jgi:hypothetical protein
MLNAIKFILWAAGFYGSLWLMLALGSIAGYKGRCNTMGSRHYLYDGNLGLLTNNGQKGRKHIGF